MAWITVITAMATALSAVAAIFSAINHRRIKEVREKQNGYVENAERDSK